MKIAITSTGNALVSPLDSRFGRARVFVLYDTETKAEHSVDNTQNLNAPQGAGIQSAMHVVEAGAQVVLTGHCGPKAFRVLKEAGIKVYLTDAPDGKEALRRFTAGELTALECADVEGHWA